MAENGGCRPTLTEVSAYRHPWGMSLHLVLSVGLPWWGGPVLILTCLQSPDTGQGTDPTEAHSKFWQGDPVHMCRSLLGTQPPIRSWVVSLGRGSWLPAASPGRTGRWLVLQPCCRSCSVTLLLGHDPGPGPALPCASVSPVVQGSQQTSLTHAPLPPRATGHWERSEQLHIQLEEEVQAGDRRAWGPRPRPVELALRVSSAAWTGGCRGQWQADPAFLATSSVKGGCHPAPHPPPQVHSSTPAEYVLRQGPCLPTPQLLLITKAGP